MLGLHLKICSENFFFKMAAVFIVANQMHKYKADHNISVKLNLMKLDRINLQIYRNEFA